MIDLLERLSSVRKNGNGWMACCPAHEDHENSLSIRRTDTSWLVKCHAGCTAEQIVGALGIGLADLFHEKKEKPKRRSSRKNSKNGGGEGGPPPER